MCETKQEKKKIVDFLPPLLVFKKKGRERNRRLIVGQSPVFVSFECYTCSCFSLFFFYPLKNKQNTSTKDSLHHFIYLHEMNTKCVKREKITLHNKQSAKFTLRKKAFSRQILVHHCGSRHLKSGYLKATVNFLLFIYFHVSLFYLVSLFSRVYRPALHRDSLLWM